MIPFDDFLDDDDLVFWALPFHHPKHPARNLPCRGRKNL